MAKKDWEKIGTISKHFSNMYGKKNSNRIIYIDNWVKGSYALVLGTEFKGKEGDYPIYQENEVIQNFGTRKEAFKELKEFIKQH